MATCPYYQPREPLFSDTCKYWRTEKGAALGYCAHPQVIICPTRGKPQKET